MMDGGGMVLVLPRWCLLLGRRSGTLAVRAGVSWRSDGCDLTAARPWPGSLSSGSAGAKEMSELRFRASGSEVGATVHVTEWCQSIP